MVFNHNEEIIVRVAAENLASCPKETTYAYTLETRPMFHVGLGATINAVDSAKMLPASIVADSTAFVYNKVYTIVITAKDFSGNEMEPYEFEFKIEEGS